MEIKVLEHTQEPLPVSFSAFPVEQVAFEPAVAAKARLGRALEFLHDSFVDSSAAVAAYDYFVVRTLLMAKTVL